MVAQEVVSHLHGNPQLYDANPKVAFDKKIKKTRATLPFIEDFSYNGPYPDPNKWLDKNVYINNTLCFEAPNRGVATFDALNDVGRSYFNDWFSSGNADSLTSTYIDLSTYNALDSIYLSFYFQPQGLGFAPEMSDSLWLYFRNNNLQWIRMWNAGGTPLQAFKIAIVPITDMQFLHDSFQFRFINTASPNTNDDIWNIDYIKIDTKRSMADSIMNDLGYTEEPSSILNKYLSMPYRHFMTNQNNERSAQQNTVLKNLYKTNQNFTSHHIAKEILSGTLLTTENIAPTNVGGGSYYLQSYNTYNITYNPIDIYDKVVVEDKYYIESLGANDRKQNDTIVRETIFDNYFAYDDGSSEKTYFLLPAANFPSKTAMEFTLNQSDTVRGLMLHFGAQIPSAAGKYFSIVLYKKLSGMNNADTIIYQQDLYKVIYENAKNGFTSYGFDTPVALPQGTYYIGVTQPANFGSDSIYYGLDVNNNNNIKYLYYNVTGTWVASGVQGTVMMRPIVGKAFTPTTTQSTNEKNNDILIYPNPTANNFYIQSKNKVIGKLFDMQGMMVKNITKNEKQVDISNLPTGNYILILIDENENYTSHKINKQ